MARNDKARIDAWRKEQRAKYGQRASERVQARITKLGRRKNSIVAFEVDGVLGRLTASQTAERQKYEAIGRTGAAILAAIRSRMQLRAEFKSGRRGQKTLTGKKARAYLLTDYVRKAGLVDYRGMHEQEDWLASNGSQKWTTYKNWSELGRQVTGAYNTSGGLWASMESRLLGKGSIVHEPFGKSDGAEGPISNREKSYKIWLLHRENLLEPSKRELDKAAQILAFDFAAAHIAGWGGTQIDYSAVEAVERELER